jgi:hypothetical protein
MAEGASEYLNPYREAVGHAGPRFESLLWRSAAAQRRRFDVLIGTCRLTGRVVADMGSGLSDLALRMHERGVEYGRYLGVEGVPQLAAESRKRLDAAGIPECEVLEADFVAEAGLCERLVSERGAEVLIFCGSLNTLDQPEAERVLDRAWDAVRRVKGGQMAFNFLSDRTPKRRESTGPARRFDTVRLFGWALDRTPLVKVRHEYWGGHDATVWMGAG